MSELEQSSQPRDPDPSRIVLDDRERTQLQRYLATPLNFPPEFVSWLEDYIRMLMTAGNISGLASRTATVGEYKLIAKDLTAQTGLYVWEDAQGAWLYCNGASISGAGYTELESFMGGTTLPDVRGRAPWACGTHVDVDLFDNDAQAEATRTPFHKHTTGTLGISGSPGLTGAPGVGSLALPNHIHSYTDPGHFHTYESNQAGGSGPAVDMPLTNSADANTSTSTTGITMGNPTTLPAITGAPSIGTLAANAGTLGLSGEVGSGMGGSDAVAFVVLGSWIIKAG